LIIRIDDIIIHTGRCGLIMDNVGSDRRVIGTSRRFASDLPQVEVFEYLFDTLPINDITFIDPKQRGHNNVSTRYIFWHEVKL